MFFWFLACGVLVVLFVFDSPAVDYRFVAAGSVLPVAETATGRRGCCTRWQARPPCCWR